MRQLLEPRLDVLGVEEDVQRAGARDAGRQFAEEEPRVLLHLLQFLQELSLTRERRHAGTLAKRGTGRSHQRPENRVTDSRHGARARSSRRASGIGA